MIPQPFVFVAPDSLKALKGAAKSKATLEAMQMAFSQWASVYNIDVKGMTYIEADKTKLMCGCLLKKACSGCLEFHAILSQPGKPTWTPNFQCGCPHATSFYERKFAELVSMYGNDAAILTGHYAKLPASGATPSGETPGREGTMVAMPVRRALTAVAPTSREVSFDRALTVGAPVRGEVAQKQSAFAGSLSDAFGGSPASYPEQKHEDEVHVSDECVHCITFRAQLSKKPKGKLEHPSISSMPRLCQQSCRQIVAAMQNCSPQEVLEIAEEMQVRLAQLHSEDPEQQVPRSQQESADEWEEFGSVSLHADTAAQMRAVARKSSELLADLNAGNADEDDQKQSGPPPAALAAAAAPAAEKLAPAAPAAAAAPAAEKLALQPADDLPTAEELLEELAKETYVPQQKGPSEEEIRLTAERDSAIADGLNMKAECERAVAHIHKMEAREEQYQQKIQELSEENAQLGHQLSAATAEIEDLRPLGSELSEAKQLIAQQAAQLAALKQQLEAAPKAAPVVAPVDNSADLTALKEQLAQAITAHQATHTKATRIITQQKEAIAAAETKVAEVTNDAEAAIERLRAEVAALQQQLALKPVAVSTVPPASTTNVSALAEAQHQVQTHIAALEVSKRETKEARESCGRLQAEKQEVEHQLATMRAAGADPEYVRLHKTLDRLYETAKDLGGVVDVTYRVAPVAGAALP